MHDLPIVRGVTVVMRFLRFLRERSHRVNTVSKKPKSDTSAQCPGEIINCHGRIIGMCVNKRSEIRRARIAGAASYCFRFLYVRTYNGRIVNVQLKAFIV